jgi:adenine deaminase
MKVTGNLVDIHNRTIYPAVISVEKGRIKSIRPSEAPVVNFILPGLIDAHVHVESSMVGPGGFAREAVKHGTVGVVSDPHEIANVMGTEGVDYMIDEGKKTPLYFWFGAPSCVPVTGFETSGAEIDSEEIEKLLERKDIKYLSEMMNYPGVVYGDAEVMKKLAAAKRKGKPVDGHAPGLMGDKLRMYVKAGISTDHECSSIEEALEKIGLGMKILIREGSAARNLDSLKPLFQSHPDMVMLCSDDLHPETLAKRHLEKIAGSLISEGFDIFDIIRSCSLNPVAHYGLEAGLLRAGDNADFIVVDDLKTMNVKETWIKGEKVFDRGKVLFKESSGRTINNFNCSEISEADISVRNEGKRLNVIEAFDGELLTGKFVTGTDGKAEVVSHTGTDILKIVVKDRYHNGSAATGLIKGFGLKKGAFASSVAHDSHNIICIGVNDADIVAAVNEIVRLKGGLAVSAEGRTESLQLNIAGIMSDRSCSQVAEDYERLSETVKSLGCRLKAPFMTLSFMALLVIPELKMSDRGLFDANQFRFTSLFED